MNRILTDNNLQINQEIIDTVFRYCPDGVVYKDSKLKYVCANRSYFNILEITQDELNHINLSDENLKLVQSADFLIEKTREPANYVLTLGNNKIVNIMSFPIVNKENSFFGIISIIHDITQEEELKEDFVNKHFKHIDTEKQLQSQRETFVASIGHDLKNPTIAQIRGLELLLKGSFGEISLEQAKMLQMILESCKYMKGMLSNMLDTYRNYGGAIKLNNTEFSLVDLSEECIAEMEYVAKEKEVSIKFELPRKDCIIYADKVQIKRVIMNLISNGIKYAYNNTILKITVLNLGDIANFEFENESPYIPKNKQEAIFAKYVSYAGKYKEPGVGLGLYASNKIITGHSGKLYVNSYPEGRNIFGFRIPTKQKLNSVNTINF